MSDSIHFHEIMSLHDPILLPWLDLFELSFPPCEKVLVSDHLKAILQGSTEHVFLAALDSEDRFIGMARYQILQEAEAAILWYLAVAPEARNSGAGSVFYQEIIRRCRTLPLKACVLEVEDPAVAENPDLASRRIEFYRRNGAKLLTGIHYEQCVGPHQPVTPMFLMVHPLQTSPFEPNQAFQLCKMLFDESLQQTGELKLE